MDLNAWMEEYRAVVKGAFGERVVCLGLQGSQARGEATPEETTSTRCWCWTGWPPTTSRGTAKRCAGCPAVKSCADLWEEKRSCWAGSRRPVCPLFGYGASCGRSGILRPLAGPDAARCCVRNGACAIYHACVQICCTSAARSCWQGCKGGLFCAARRVVLPHRPDRKATPRAGATAAPAQRALLEGTRRPGRAGRPAAGMGGPGHPHGGRAGPEAAGRTKTDVWKGKAGAQSGLRLAPCLLRLPRGQQGRVFFVPVGPHRAHRRVGEKVQHQRLADAGIMGHNSYPASSLPECAA